MGADPRTALRRTPALGALALAGLLGALPLAAQPGKPAARAGAGETGPTASQLPPELADVGFDQRLGESVPLDLTFTDEAGRQVELGDYFGERPVILVPVYYDCPLLCPMIVETLARSLKELPFAAGEELEVVAVSFDPRETPEQARRRKQSAMARYDRPEAAGGLHFLTGEAAAIGRFTEAIGFRYAYDEASGEFAHAAGLVVATPDGQISRYFFGLDYPSRALRLSLVEAAGGGIGSLSDRVLLFCFQYDPATGRYSAMTMNLIRLGGVVTMAALGLGIFLMLRREKAARPHPGAA